MEKTTGQKLLDVLQLHNLKKEPRDPKGNEKYRCNSPLRPGSDSHAFVVTIAPDGEHGGYFDHVSEDKGSLYELADKLGIKRPDRLPAIESKRIYTGLADYAEAHGVTPDCLRSARWYETTYGSNGKERRALAFETKSGTRWRFLDGNKPYYTSPLGYKSCWYGLLNVQTMQRLTAGQPLVLANGEISVVTATYTGLASACVTAGERGFSQALIGELVEFLGPNPKTEIIVAFDCDNKGRKSALLVQDQLREAGLNARAVDLRLTDKGDLADFCVLHAEHATERIKECPTLERDPNALNTHLDDDLGFYFIHESQLHELPTVQWLIGDALVADGINMIYGASGIGKSFLALDYALQIAQNHPVIYIAGEGEYGYRQRIEAWYKFRNIPARTGNLWLVVGAPAMLEAPQIEGFLLQATPIKPIFVVIDTVAMAMVGAEENSARDMGNFMRVCKRLRRELGCATLLVHHSQKEGNLERGSSALRGACDHILRLSQDDEIISVEVSKSKDSAKPPIVYKKLLPVKVTINGEEMESAVMIDAEKVIQTPDSRLSINQQKVLETLAMDIYQGSGAEGTEIAELTELSRGSTLRALNGLKKLGFAHQTDGPRSPFAITPAGLNKIENLTKQGA